MSWVKRATSNYNSKNISLRIVNANINSYDAAYHDLSGAVQNGWENVAMTFPVGGLCGCSKAYITGQQLFRLQHLGAQICGFPALDAVPPGYIAVRQTSTTGATFTTLSQEAERSAPTSLSRRRIHGQCSTRVTFQTPLGSSTRPQPTPSRFSHRTRCGHVSSTRRRTPTGAFRFSIKATCPCIKALPLRLLPPMIASTMKVKRD